MNHVASLMVEVATIYSIYVDENTTVGFFNLPNSWLHLLTKREPNLHGPPKI